MLTCTLSRTYSREQVTPSLELGTSKGSMISAVVAGMSKAGTPDHTNTDDNSLPISHCYRDFKEGVFFWSIEGMFKQHLHQVLLKSSGAQARSEKHSPIAMCPTVTPTGSWLRSRDQNGEPRPRVGQKV